LNYRSSQEVIDLFLPLAEQDELTQKLSARMKAVTRERGNVEIRDFIDESEQATATAQSIAERIFAGAKPESCAVLSRTRALLAQFADEFEYRGLPYRWSGKNFWLSNEVQDVLAFARLAINPKDGEAVARIICSTMELTKYLGMKFADAVVNSAKARGVGPLDVRLPDGNWRGSQLERWETARNVIRGIVRNGGAAPRSFVKQVLEETGLERGGEAGEDPDDFKGENLIALTGRASRFTNIRDFLFHADVMDSPPALFGIPKVCKPT
jgi:DNA helicase-2/ATP-dependent DNA helicase PcrA